MTIFAQVLYLSSNPDMTKRMERYRWMHCMLVMLMALALGTSAEAQVMDEWVEEGAIR